MKTPESNFLLKRLNEETKSERRSDDAAGLNLDDYPIEVLEAVLTILKSRSEANS